MDMGRLRHVHLALLFHRLDTDLASPAHELATKYLDESGDAIFELLKGVAGFQRDQLSKRDALNAVRLTGTAKDLHELEMHFAVESVRVAAATFLMKRSSKHGLQPWASWLTILHCKYQDLSFMPLYLWMAWRSIFS